MCYFSNVSSHPWNFQCFIPSKWHVLCWFQSDVSTWLHHPCCGHFQLCRVRSGEQMGPSLQRAGHRHNQEWWPCDRLAVCRSMKGTRMKSIRERRMFLSDVDGGVVPDTPLKGTNVPFNPLKSTNMFRLDPRLTHALGILPRANPPVV